MTLGWTEHLRKSAPIAWQRKGAIAWCPTVDDGFVISCCLGRLRESTFSNFPRDLVSPSSFQDSCLVTPARLKARESNGHVTSYNRILEDRICGEHITWRMLVLDNFTLHWVAAVAEFDECCIRSSVAGINSPSLNVLRAIQVLRFNNF